MKPPLTFGLNFVSLFIFSCQLPVFALPADLPAALAALAATEPTPAAAVPKTGQFYSARMVQAGLNVGPLLPGGMGLEAWNLGDGVWLVNDLAVVTPWRNRTMALAGGGLPPGAGEGGGDTNYLCVQRFGAGHESALVKRFQRAGRRGFPRTASGNESSLWPLHGGGP